MSIHDHPHQALPCVIMRGGTTRGFLFQKKHLPSSVNERDQMFLDIVAGHGLVQADGLGGRDMLLSKVVNIWPSTRSDADIDCVYGVITPGSDRVKYGSNCGNLVSAVSLYAVEEGLVPSPTSAVTIFNPDSNSRVVARFMAPDEFREVSGELVRSGTPTVGTPVMVAFLDPSGTIGRGLLPSGQSIDRLRLSSGAQIDVSIVDSGTVYVFIAAADLGIEFVADDLTARQQNEILLEVENLRGQAAVLCGLAPTSDQAHALTPAVPKISLLSRPRRFAPQIGAPIEPDEIDIVGHIVSSQNFHGGYSVTGAIATIAASVLPGSVVNRMIPGAGNASPSKLRIGHRRGITVVRQDWHEDDGIVTIDQARLVRTTRRLMSGQINLSKAAVAPSTNPTRREVALTSSQPALARLSGNGRDRAAITR